MSRKFIAIISALALVVTLLAPVGVQEASAASDNSVDRVPSVSDDYNFANPDGTPKANMPTLTLENKNKTWGPKEVFRLTIPENAEWNKIGTTGAVYDSTVSHGTIKVEKLTKRVIEVTLTGATDEDATAKIPLNVEFDGVAEGEARVTIDSRDSAITSGSYAFAVVGSGATVTTIASKKSFARSVTLADIQIDETKVNALGNKRQKITLKLPPKFTWDKIGTVKGTGGLSGTTAPSGKDLGETGSRTLEIWVTPVNDGTRGSLFLSGYGIRADRDAAYGEVVVDVDGDEVTSTDLVVANYANYGVVVDVKEVKDLVAGKMSKNNKTATITIEETVEGSLIPKRELVVELPEWVKIVSGSGIDMKAATGGLKTSDANRAKNQNEFYFTINEDIVSTTKSKYEFQLELSIEADKSGEIEAIFSGAGMEEQSLVIANAVAPVTATVDTTELRIGVQNQPAPNIIIEENGKGYIADRDNKDERTSITVTVGEGIKFSKTPKVTILEGNGEFTTEAIKADGRVLTIPVKSESTRPMKFEISDIELTLDRTVPEGKFNVDVGGNAIVENYKKDSGLSDPDNFDKARVVRVHFADVITPAPGETRSTSVFTIDSTNYTVVQAGVEVERTMDVAPYIKDSRTFLPVFFVAQSLGVSENNIIWEPHSKTVTVIKGDRIAQMQIGNTVLTVNGTAIQMDTAPEIKDGRTMLPIYYVGQALGASVEWDGDARTVTVKQ